MKRYYFTGVKMMGYSLNFPETSPSTRLFMHEGFTLSVINIEYGFISLI